MFNMASEGRTLTRLSLLKQLFSTGTCDCNLNCTLGKCRSILDLKNTLASSFFSASVISIRIIFLSWRTAKTPGFSALVSVRSNYTSVRKKKRSFPLIQLLRQLFSPLIVAFPARVLQCEKPRHNSYWRHNLRFCLRKYYQQVRRSYFKPLSVYQLLVKQRSFVSSVKVVECNYKSLTSEYLC